MANVMGQIGKGVDEISEYLKRIKIPGTDMNLGDAVIGFFTTLGGASIVHAGMTAIPSLATIAGGPVGGAIALIGGAWIGKEVAQAAGVDVAIKKPNDFMIASAVLTLLATVFMPQAVFTVAPAGTTQALQSVTLLVK